MRFWVILFGLFSFCTQNGCGQTNKYDNYTLIQLYPTTNEQMLVATKFKDPESQVEVLKNSRDLGDSMDLLVPPSRMEYMKDFIDDMKFTAVMKQRNYGRTFESMDRLPRRRVLKRFSPFEYNSYAAILEYTETLARQFPHLVQLQSLGKSYEGRDVKLVKISANPNAGNPIIFVDAGIHAREWVAPCMAQYAMHRLTHSPDALQNELNGIDWYFIPVVNPDGYEYSRSSKSNRLWRKTRSKNRGCYGVDGNRNYGFKWGVSGVSTDPCEYETFAGSEPFSEPETRMVRKALMDNANRIKLYVSLHAYGQYLVYPWGYTGQSLPREWKKLDSLARAVSSAVVNAGGSPFKVLSAGKWYAAAGGSDDFAFGAVGVPYSYTMELTQGYEFVYPSQLLPKVLPQFYEGFKVFASRIKQEFGKSQHDFVDRRF